MRARDASSSSSTTVLPPTPVATATGEERYSSVEEIVSARVDGLHYLKKVYEGRELFLESFVIFPNQFRKFLVDKESKKKLFSKTAAEFFAFGTSLGSLVTASGSNIPFVIAVMKLLEEYEDFYGYSSITDRGLRLLKTRSDEKQGVYFPDYLNVQDLPMDLDYCEVSLSLIDLFSHFYRKLAAEVSHEQCGLFQKIDSKINSLFLRTIIKHLKGYSQHLIHQLQIETQAQNLRPTSPNSLPTSNVSNANTSSSAVSSIPEEDSPKPPAPKTRQASVYDPVSYSASFFTLSFPTPSSASDASELSRENSTAAGGESALSSSGAFSLSGLWANIIGDPITTSSGTSVSPSPEPSSPPSTTTSSSVTPASSGTSAPSTSTGKKFLSIFN